MKQAMVAHCEDRLKQAEIRLNAMGELTDNWLWETDENHVFNYFTDSVTMLTGIKKQDLLGTSRLDLARNSTEPHWQNHARDLEKYRPFKDFKYVRHSPQGDARHLIITGWPIFDDVGGFTGYRGVARDETDAKISRLRQVEKEESLLSEIERQRSSLATVLENLGQSVMWFDQHGSIRLNNVQTAKLLGFEEDEYSKVYNLRDHLRLMAMRGDFGDVDVEVEVEARVQRLCQQTKTAVSYRIHLKSNDRFLDVELRPLVDGSRILTHTDVTTEARESRKVKENEAQLEAMQVDLAQANELLEDRVEQRTVELRRTQDLLVKNERQALLGDLVASLCHELRNPLNALSTSLFLIRRTVEKDFPKLSKAFDRTERTITRCTNILNDLFDYALVGDLKKESISIAPWLGSVVQQVEIPKSFDVILDIDNQLPVCDLDPDQLGRAVRKIITNAAQAIADTHDPTSNPKIEIYAGDCGDCVEIIVSDNGAGMNDETFARALEPLFSTRGFGVGLGLPIAEQVIKRHGGGILLETLEGVGTTVTIWLPTPIRPVLKAA